MSDRRSDPPYDPRYDGPRGSSVDPRGRPERAGRDFDPYSGDHRGYPPEGRRGRSRTQLAVIAAAIIGLLLVAFFAFRLARGGPGEDRLDDAAGTGNATATRGAAQRCGSQRTYDLVKQELFRRASQVRGSDQAAFDRLSAYAVVRVGAPVLKRQDDQLGTQVCSGRVSIDLPPGVAVVGGRRTLTADADYALTPAADGSGDVVTLSGADAIIVPLATLARTGAGPSLPQPQAQPAPGAGTISPPAPSPVPIPAPAPSAPEAAAPVAPRSSSSANPSFNCALARTRGEIAVCNDPELAEADRFMAARYVSAFGSADPSQRVLLQRTRDRFLAYRDRCRSDSCIAEAYRDRVREIDDIRAGRWVPPR